MAAIATRVLLDKVLEHKIKVDKLKAELQEAEIEMKSAIERAREHFDTVEIDKFEYNGFVFTREFILTMSIKEENKAKVEKWVKQNEPDLLKGLVSIEFGKGDMKKALFEMKRLAKLYPNEKVKIESGVNTNSLKAVVKKHLQSGKKVPEYMGANSMSTLKIKEKK